MKRSIDEYNISVDFEGDGTFKGIDYIKLDYVVGQFGILAGVENILGKITITFIDEQGKLTIVDLDAEQVKFELKIPKFAKGEVDASMYSMGDDSVECVSLPEGTKISNHASDEYAEHIMKRMCETL